MPRKSVLSPSLNGRSGGAGRPTKRSPQVEAELFRHLETGCPINLACEACGISPTAFCEWRRIDAEFGRRAEQVIAQGLCSNVASIRRQGQKAWQGLAWLLERRLPVEFARPETQLTVGVQANINGQSGDGSGLTIEMVVASDADYMRLREHPEYAAVDSAVREVESSVSSELRGSLHKRGTHAVVISEAQERDIQRRVDEANAKIDAFFQRRTGNNGGS